MFDTDQDHGVFDSWVERWRAFRGVNHWPIVPGRLFRKTWVDSGEHGSWKLQLTYQLPSAIDPAQTVSIATIYADRGSTYAEAPAGDIIELRAHPARFDKAVLADTSQAASHLMALVIFGSPVLLIAVVKGCSYLRR